MKLKWRRPWNYKNHLQVEPCVGVLMEIDGEHYRITVNGEVTAEDNGHSQQYCVDLCEAWLRRYLIAELATEEVANG